MDDSTFGDDGRYVRIESWWLDMRVYVLSICAEQKGDELSLVQILLQRT